MRSHDKTHLTVALYEPFGAEGICHYTYQLANALSQIGSDVTVITRAPYELAALPRLFSLNTRLSQTQTKAVLRRIARYLSLRKASMPRKVEGASHPEQQSQNRSGLYDLVYRWLIWLELLVYLLRTRPSVVHFQWFSRIREGAIFCGVLRLLGFRTVYTAHNVRPHEAGSSNMAAPLARLYRSVSGIVVHAPSNREELLQQFNVPAQKVSVIPHGAYDLFYADAQVDQRLARQRLKLPLDKQVVLFFGLIRRYKGLEYLTQAFDLMQQYRGNTVLLVVGSLPKDRPEEAAFYSSLLSSLSGRPDIICRQGYVPSQEVGLYFSAADIVALPYVKTYQSGILLSAYAAGRPVVATRTGGLAEVVEDGQSGIIVPPQDGSALANAIELLLGDPHLRAKMGEHALWLAQHKYAWRDIAEKTRSLYAHLSGHA